MDQLPALGTAIHEIVPPTFKVYDPLLRKNADYIRSTKKETFAYGSLDRQQLDVYYPTQPSIRNGRKPVLMFAYGGGFVNGARTLPIADELCHANIGTFFANKYGYTVVVVDYRLVSHGAKFPSGGEDLALAAEWILKTGVNGHEPVDLYMMGNSAGGVHVLTFLLHPDFSSIRHKLLSGSGTRLRGAIGLAPPFHFQAAHPSRAETLEAYFGDIQANCPMGLLQSRKADAPFDWVKAGVRLLVLDADLDPIDEIRVPKDDFLKEWALMPDNESRSALAVDTIHGQNHISPFLTLSTGIEQEEAWGHQVTSFMETIRKFQPREPGER